MIDIVYYFKIILNKKSRYKYYKIINDNKALCKPIEINGNNSCLFMIEPSNLNFLMIYAKSQYKNGKVNMYGDYLENNEIYDTFDQEYLKKKYS